MPASRENATPYIIRPATPGDFPALNRLCVDAYQEFETFLGSANWQKLRDTLSHASSLSTVGDLLVAETAAGLQGVVLYLPPGSSDGIQIPTEWASIRMLAFSPASRGQGIGKRLTQACIERARRDGATAIGLTTGSMMKIARSMYERLGFQKEADLGSRFGVDHARYVLFL